LRASGEVARVATDYVGGWAGRGVAFSVHFRVDLDAVPEPAREEIRRTVDAIAEALETVPPSSPFWRSTRDSVLQIDVLNFRVVYRVDERHHDLLVVELEKKRLP